MTRRALLSASLLLATATATACTGDAPRAGHVADTTRLGIGRPASAERIARWDIDAGPGGDALPAGSGTVAEGRAVYATHCASCHGARGEGIAPNPRLVGRDSASDAFRFADDPKLEKTIGNYWPYAYTLFDYVKRAMPHGTPHVLRDGEIYAVTAYLLHENGVLPADARLDAAALRAVRMPAASRFVPDERRGGREIR